MLGARQASHPRAARGRCAPDASDRRCRRSACRRRGDMRRAGVARHHHRRSPRERHHVGNRRLRRQQRRAAARATTSSPISRSPGPHKTTDIKPCRSRSATASAPNRDGRPALVGPGRARVEQRVAAAGLLERLPRRRRVDLLDGKFRRRGVNAERLEQSQIDLHDVPRSRSARTCRRRRDRRRRCRTAARTAHAEYRAAKPTTRGAPDAARDERRLDQPLQIDRDVVARAPQLAHRGHDSTAWPSDRGPSRRRSITSRRSMTGTRSRISRCFALTSQSIRADG